MKTQLQKELAKIAPSISIETIWEHDIDHGPVSKECCGFDESEDDDWQCWQSEIRATTIQNGDEVSGSAYLGGTYEKYGDNPATSNPEISGYEPQMTEEALEDLLPLISITDRATRNQINKAIKHIKRKMHESYEAQRQQLATA